jgi:hypothetical protein
MNYRHIELESCELNMNKYNIHALFIMLGMFIQVLLAQQSVQTISPCVGKLDDGRVIDLTSLAASNGYRYSEQKIF